MDVVCEGRFTLGVGLGYRDVESDAFGIRSRERVRRLEENLRLVEALWAGAAVSADLPWCRLNDATLTILPVQRPRPPVWMAADNDRAVARAARMADTWIINPHATSVRRTIVCVSCLAGGTISASIRRYAAMSASSARSSAASPTSATSSGSPIAAAARSAAARVVGVGRWASQSTRV